MLKPVVYLPLQAFGDFIITAGILKYHICRQKIPIALPKYLLPLFSTLHLNEHFDIAFRIGFDSIPAFNNVRNNKTLSGIIKIIKDFLEIKRLPHTHRYILDYRSRRMFITGLNCIWPNTTENIYEGKQKLFSFYFNLISNDKQDALVKVKPNTKNRIIVFPDSSNKSKMISSNVVEAILNMDPNLYKPAYFDREPLPDATTGSYKDFKELCNIILTADLIISADSLPVHLAYYFGVSHFVIYNNKLNDRWATPFILKNNAYAVYNGKTSKVITSLNTFLSQDYIFY